MNLRHRPAIALLCLPLLLTGCSEDDEEPEAKPPATSAAVTTPSGTASAEALEEKSEQGIRAFLERWAQTISEASRTGDTGEFDALAREGCRSCDSVSQYLNELYDGGGRLETGEYRVLQVGQLPASASIDKPLVATTIRKPREVVFRDNNETVIPAERQAYQFDLQWTKRGWRIAQFGLIQ